MKGGMIVAKKDMSALLGGLANKSEKEQAIYDDVGHWGFSFINGMQHV